MNALVLILALAGALALVLRLGRTLLRLALRAAEVAAASGMAEISARRGDLTGMTERQAAVRAARSARRRDGLLALLWLLWLVIPLFTDWTRELFAVAAPLWLLPAPPVRTESDPGSTTGE